MRLYQYKRHYLVLSYTWETMFSVEVYMGNNVFEKKFVCNMDKCLILTSAFSAPHLPGVG